MAVDYTINMPSATDVIEWVLGIGGNPRLEIIVLSDVVQWDTVFDSGTERLLRIDSATDVVEWST